MNHPPTAKVVKRKTANTYFTYTSLIGQQDEPARARGYRGRLTCGEVGGTNPRSIRIPYRSIPRSSVTRERYGPPIFRLP